MLYKGLILEKYTIKELKLLCEIFQDAYVLGRKSGSDGVFLCPKSVFKQYLHRKNNEFYLNQSNEDNETAETLKVH